MDAKGEGAGYSRVERVRQRLEGEGVDAFFTLDQANRRYLTGFTGSAGMAVILPSASVLLVDFRYTEQARVQARGWDVRQVEDFFAALAGLLRESGVRRVGFEEHKLTYGAWRKARQAAEDVEWVPTRMVVEQVRGRKEPQELERIRRAVELGDRAFSFILDRIRPGVSERELALELDFFLRREGAEALSFDTIVASGPNGALPHARPTDRRLQAGDLIVLDFGCVLDGYCSDMTRTVCLGKADEKQKELYHLVLRAQRAGLDAVRPGVLAKDVDRAARDIIESAGFGDMFGHGLGHGVGLEVHEEVPRLSKKGEVRLEPGMVASVEPGVYLPGWGGIRIEDLVVVTADGREVLTRSPKELIELPA